MGHRTAMTGDRYFFARFHPVQQFAQMGLRLSQVDCDHEPLTRDQKTSHSKLFAAAIAKKWSYRHITFRPLRPNTIAIEPGAGQQGRTRRRRPRIQL
jgi:hypothetical protein